MPNLHETIERLKEGEPSSAVLGRRFEVFVQDVFKRHPGEYGKERFAEVWLWQEWPDRESYGYGTDYGIDIVAKQTDAYGGGLCAIQVKFVLRRRRYLKILRRSQIVSPVIYPSIHLSSMKNFAAR